MSIEIPIGAQIAWNKSFSQTPSLPYGWAELNGQVVNDGASVYNGLTLDNDNGSGAGTHRFLRGSTTSGTTGGTETHTHTIANASLTNLAAASTTYSTATITGSTPTLPSYKEIVWIMRIK